MHKVVYNDCYGNFSLSGLARYRLEEATGGPVNMWDHPRHCPHLVRIVEELGRLAGEEDAWLKVYALRGNKYRITAYDGAETVREPHNAVWIEIKTEPEDG